uniref:Uncharacterized protein n=1 Tax=Anopheles coluzzii TaxID=1518534 RepID=A0A6E8VLC2_ANOCL
KMANLKHKQEIIMLQIEKAKRSKRSYANNSSNLEQDEREQQQCNEAVNVSEADEKVCIGTVPADPEALATVEPIVCTRQHASAQPALQLQNCSVAKAHAQLDCESRDNVLPSEAFQSGGAEPLSMYALRSTVLRIPFRMVSITNQRGHQGIDTQRTLDDRPATTLVPSELAQSASVAGTVDSTVPERGVEVDDRNTTHRSGSTTRDRQIWYSGNR